MSICRNFRVLGFTLCWLWLLLAPASAQWLFEKKPSAEGSAFEMAGHAPAEAQVMIGFHLLGQVDVLGVIADIREAARVLTPSKRSELMALDAELGVSLEEWLGYFTGSGYLALLERQTDEDWSESMVLAVELKQPSLFSKWLVTKMGRDLPQRKVGNFVVRQISERTQFGLGQDWFFIASNDLMADRTMAAISGTEKTLDSVADFVRAKSSLTGGGSGLFVYLQGRGVRQNVFDWMDLAQDDPAADQMAFWDFAVMSVDFSKQQVDAFLAYPAGKGAVLTALRSAGRVDASLLNLVSVGPSAVAAGDLGWLAGVVEAVGEEFPELAMMLALAQGQLSAYGDLGEVFAGTVVVASNPVEVLGQLFRTDMRSGPEQGDLIGCESNLKNIATAAEIWSTDYEGAYPKTMEELVPEYLVEVPTCPAGDGEAYRYRLIQQEGPSYSITCTGHKHPSLQSDHPQYSGYEGLNTGEVTPSEDSAEEKDVLDNPSVVVAAPVKSLAAAHDLALRLSRVGESNEADVCAETLTELSLLLDEYAVDHDGRYPKSFADLIPDYVAEMPTCATAGVDTYSKSYLVTESEGEMGFQHAAFYCQGHHHPELETDRPAFSTQDGLVMGPSTPSADKAAVVAPPEKGQQRSYTTTFGPTLEVDGSLNALRLVYGPRAESFFKENAPGLAQHPMVGRALAWGDRSVIYLDYLNLQPFYDAVMEVTQRESENGDSEAIFLEKLLRKSRARVGSLEGVSCWKVSPDGLHYRSSGLGTGQVVLPVVLTAMVGFPDFAKSRDQGELIGCESNLKNIGTALEMWSTDYSGEYPKSLEQLTPDYLRTIPACPAAGEDTYSESYCTGPAKKNGGVPTYSFHCSGHHHEDAGLPSDRPAYNGERGLIED